MKRLWLVLLFCGLARAQSPKLCVDWPLLLEHEQRVALRQKIEAWLAERSGKYQVVPCEAAHDLRLLAYPQYGRVAGPYQFWATTIDSPTGVVGEVSVEQRVTHTGAWAVALYREGEFWPVYKHVGGNLKKEVWRAAKFQEGTR